MRCYKPNIQDAVDIHCLLEDNIASRLESHKQGFLCNRISLLELQSRIKHGHYNRIIAKDKFSGYLLAFSNREAQEYLNSGYIQYEKLIFNKYLDLSENFIWLDQLCIHHNLRCQGYGSKLLLNAIEEFMNDGYNKFYGIVSLSPHLNLRSFSFLHKLLGVKIVSIHDIDSVKWALIKLGN